MVKVKCPSKDFGEYAKWLRPVVGTALNLDWKSNEKRFEDPKYTVGWKSIAKSQGGLCWIFKNHEDAVAFKLRFGL